MWWIPIGTGLVLGFAILCANFFQQKRRSKGITNYRGRYLQLVSQLEHLTDKVNVLHNYVPTVKDEKVLDYYESTLRILETLIGTMKKVTPFGAEPTVLNSAFYLVKDCNARVDRANTAFRECLKGKQVDLDKLYNRAPEPLKTGCYFCSRPYIRDSFSKTKVKMDGKSKTVLSCRICKEELLANKKVKVLHLVKDGKTLHWSKVSDYVPSEDYWNINKKKSEKKVTKLELIVSQKEPLNSRDNFDHDN